MNYEEAMEHTRNKPGMKQSIPGFLSKISGKLAEHCGDYSEMDRFVLGEISGHFCQARKAWLDGDLHTVAEFFGLYVD